MASDGIWEFMPNSEVINIVLPFYISQNPKKACSSLISKAVNHWKKVTSFFNPLGRRNKR